MAPGLGLLRPLNLEQSRQLCLQIGHPDLNLLACQSRYKPDYSCASEQHVSTLGQSSADQCHALPFRDRLAYVGHEVQKTLNLLESWAGMLPLDLQEDLTNLRDMRARTAQTWHRPAPSQGCQSRCKRASLPVQALKVRAKFQLHDGAEDLLQDMLLLLPGPLSRLSNRKAGDGSQRLL